MEKNEVYDYLAKIYLDKQPAAKTEKKKPARNIKVALLLLIVVSVGIVSAALFVRYPKRFLQPKAYGLYLATGNELIKLKYNFVSSSTKKEGYTLTLSDFNAAGYQLLQFQARSLSDDASLKVRVELENNLKENSFSYVSGIGSAWKQFTLKLVDFKELTRLDTLNRLSFIIEEWNVVGKENCIYIDEIRLIKEK
jgi:hypothetical protein